jgi:hypothetical protein
MSEKTAAHSHKAATDTHSPVHAMFGMWKSEMLKFAEEQEKMTERSLVEMKRATVEGARLWESQIELQASMTRAAFDGVRRMWNF